MKLDYIITAESIDVHHNPINEKYSFSSLDKYIYIFFQVTDLDRNSIIEMKILSPSGDELQTIQYKISEIYNHLGVPIPTKEVFFSQIDTRQFSKLLSKDFGKWTIQISFNNKIVGEKVILVKNFATYGNTFG